VKVRTALNIDPQTIHQELHSTFGDNTQPKLLIEKWSYYYQEKNTNMTRSRESSTDGPPEDIEEVRLVVDTIIDMLIKETDVNTNMHSEITSNQLLDNC
jgi:hypothetical protein